MKKEDKDLLASDLCARLPYGVKCKLSANGESLVEDLQLGGLSQFLYGRLDVQPYLRPISSMTEEEKEEWEWMNPIPDGCYPIGERLEMFDWLNARHFDYRGLIEKGLAFEAPEDMYN